MSKTPKVDSLVKRHEKETDALKRRILDSKTIQHRAIRQVTELLELARSLEGRPAEAHEEIKWLKERIKELTGEGV